MSIIKTTKHQIQQYLQTGKTDLLQLQPYLSTALPAALSCLHPTTTYPQHIQPQSPDPQLVYTSLTVQDILQPEYYYAYLVKKPVREDSEVCVLKYGVNLKEYQGIQLEEYQGVMEVRETLVCVGEFYGSKWVDCEWRDVAGVDRVVHLKVSGKHEFRLGEKINAVCVWNPQDKHLIYVRPATEEQIQKQKLDFDSVASKQEIDVQESRKQLIQSLETFCTQRQALMLLFSMISDEPMFINGENILQQVSELLPRVCHIKIKAPFKKSLFPYKNQEGQLVQTPMQMNMAKTFVIIDFSQFSEEKEIKINQAEIDNLKALKMFVEEGKTIYRWEYGESLLDHIHSGIIVKGSKIITPHYHLADHLVQPKPDKNPFTSMPVPQKQKLRVYLKKCFEKAPKLSEQAREKIELDLKDKVMDSKLMLQQRMQLARLNAKTFCRETIQFEDYLLAGKILELDK